MFPVAVAKGAGGPRRGGFTLIELLVVMAIVALLASIAFPRYFQSLDRSKEVVLMENLRIVRESIERFYGDTGRYPESVDELVSRHYLRNTPVDPVTESDATWILVPPEAGMEGNIHDIRSGAPGMTRDGKPYGNL